MNPGEMPVAIIQKWDYARGKVGIGTIDTIQETVVNKLSSPAIIVIGEVVGDSKKEQFYEELKSNHNTVLVYGKE
jgi:uroporphyrin-III C-methyltransferase